MSYSQDYESRNIKIPYDDIPISRRPSSNSRGGRSSGSGQKISLSGFKLLVTLVSVLFIINIGLIIALVYHMNNAIKKDVNINNITVDASDSVAVSVAAASKAKWSSVCVAVGGSAKYEDDFYTSMYRSGAGIIFEVDEVNNAAYFVTCDHVVTGYENSVYVLLPSQLVSYKVEVVAQSSEYDLAVLKLSPTGGKKIENILDSCTEVAIADSALLAVGEPVIACGNPLSDGLKITTGTLSAINRLIGVKGSDNLSRVLQIDAPINPGNSGGGLFNAEGDFIGIVSAKLPTTTVEGQDFDVDGQAFSIPGNLVVGFARNAIKNDDNDSKTRPAPSCFDLGATFDHNVNGGRTPVLVNGKFIDKYVVEVSYTAPASPSSGKFSSYTNDVILRFKYTNVYGVEKTVEMYNKYCFDDVKFDIKDGSIIYFECAGGKTVQIEADNFEA